MKRILFITIILALALLAFACGGGSKTSTTPTAGGNPNVSAGVPNSPTSLNAVKHASSLYSGEHEDWTYDLIGAQNGKVGEVKIWNDNENFYLDWTLYSTNVMTNEHVGFWICPDAHNTSPNPGHFQYNVTYNPPEGSHLTTIPFSLLLEGNRWCDPIDLANGKFCLDIAVHSSYKDANGITQTLWGGHWTSDGNGEWDFSWSKGWGGGIDINVMPIFSELPKANVPFVASFSNAPYSYWKIDFVGNPAFQWPGGNTWSGWCTDPQWFVGGSTRTATLYSCYDDELPLYARSDNWDLVSYMINKKHHNGYDNFSCGGDTGYRYEAFQSAIWYLKYGDGTYTPDPIPWYWTKNWNPQWSGSTPSNLAAAYIDDAIANGEGYIPGSGDWFAIILWPGDTNDPNQIFPSWHRPDAGMTDYQMNIIEVDP